MNKRFESVDEIDVLTLLTLAKKKNLKVSFINDSSGDWRRDLVSYSHSRIYPDMALSEIYDSLINGFKQNGLNPFAGRFEKFEKHYKDS